MHPLHARGLTVVETVDLSSTMRRVVLALDEDDADVVWTPLACGDHLKLAVPDDAGVLRVPTVVDDRPVRPDAVLLRDYTVRAAGAGTVTLDLVLHEHGPAGRWAIAAKPGDRVGSIGPRGSVRYVGSARRFVIAGDDTALPAISRWLEELPADSRIDAIISVADAASEQPLAERDGIRVRWVHRADGETLADALAHTEVDGAFVWIAGEATELIGIRRSLRARGVSSDRLVVDGYWKAGVADLDHHQPLDPDDPDDGV